MKKATVVLLLLVCAICSPLFASVTGGVDGLLVAKTQHFDVIYQPESVETAALIHENCEAVYESLVQFFGTDPEFHIPVVVTQEYKVLNAYYTAYPANRIVIFDTVGEHGDLSNYPDTILYVFRHELTHAFQFNLRGTFTQLLSDIFGDVISTSALLYMTPSLSEGGAVLSESADGYGRINNSYSMQIVRQAKLEGLFPSWYDIVGCRDTYPTGLLYYNFSAAFLEYLSQQYGREAVASLYVDFGTKGWFRTTAGLIKERLGIEVERAWQFFYQWVGTPEEVAHSEAVKARPESGHYSNIVLAPDGNVYAYDLSSWSVLRFGKSLSSYRTVLTLPTNNQSFSVSSTGRILIPYLSETVSEVRLYSPRTLEHTFEDFRDGCFVAMEGKEFALLYSNKGQRTYLDLYDLETFEPVEGKSLELGYGVTASSFCILEDGRVAFIANHAAKDYVAVLEPKTMELSVVDNPIDARLMSISAGLKDGKQVVSLSWHSADALDGTLGRYGEFEPDGETFIVRLAETDVLGSMNSALRLEDTVLFDARYYDHEKLQTIDVGRLAFTEDFRLYTHPMFETTGPDISNLESLSGDYRPSRYLKDGVLIPMGTLSYGKELMEAGVGVTWLTLDPTETYMHELTAGFGTNGPFVGYRFESSEIIPYSVYANALAVIMDDSIALEPKGSFCFEAGGETKLNFNLRHLGETLTLQEKLDLYLGFNTSDVNFSFENRLGVSYSNARNTGANPYAVLGYGVSANLYNQYPGVGAVVRLPRLLWWIDCDGPNVTNLPATLSGYFSYYYGGSFAIDSSLDLVLFSHEVQRGVSFLGLYFQRSTIEASYNARYVSATQSFTNEISTSFNMELSPMIGEYLSNAQVKLGLKYVTDLKDSDYFTISFGASL